MSQGPPWGWTAPGVFVPKPASAILADMQASIHANIDDTLDLSEQTADGQLLAIVANEFAAMWQLAEIAANQYSREGVQGAGADNLGDVVGIPREGESFTTVYCDVTLAAGTYAAGSLVANIAGSPAQTFSNVGQIITTGGVVGGVLFESSVEGATPAIGAGTLTVISTPVTGWSAINNPAAVPGAGGTLGSNEELDAAYLARQAAEIASEGSCTPAATAAALVELGAAQQPPVTLTVTVIENEGPYQATVQGVPLPPHTYMVVIDDGGVGYSSSSPLGNVTTTSGSTAITFATAQTLPQGQALSFAVQPGLIYYLAAAISSSTAGVLTLPFSGASVTLGVALPGTGWLPNAAGQSIGATIYANKPAAITPFGTTALIVPAPGLSSTYNGVALDDEAVVYFSAPTPMPLYVSAALVPQPGSNIAFPDLVAAVQDALIAAAAAPTLANSYPPTGQLAPGSTVVGSQLEAVITNVPGVFDVQDLTFDFVSSPTNTTPIQLEATEVATITAANVANLVFTLGTYP